jgi:4-carboxymuconolactone decarboxylase
MLKSERPRIEPLLPCEWGPIEIEALGAFPGPMRNVLTGWRENETIIPGAHAVGTFARHPAMAKAFLTFNEYTAKASTLSPRVCELLILRLSWLLKCEYAFVRHVAAGKRAGISDDEIERVQLGADAAGWDSLDAALIRAVDEMHRDASIGDATWARLSSELNSQQLLDLIFVVGCYWCVSMMMNSCRLLLEATATPLTEQARTRMLST